MRIILIVITTLLLTACTTTDKQSESFVAPDIPTKPKKFILLGAGEYEGELTLALVRNGFSIKPVAVIQSVTELESQNRLIRYKEAGYRYALKISLTHDYAWVCAFSGSHRVNAIMTVIDLQSNETLAVIKQVGPDNTCPPLTPVWPLLAEELARAFR